MGTVAACGEISMAAVNGGTRRAKTNQVLRVRDN